jgi:hypothetical protein
LHESYVGRKMLSIVYESPGRIGRGLPLYG